MFAITSNKWSIRNGFIRPGQLCALLLLLVFNQPGLAQCDDNLPRRLPGRALDCEPPTPPQPEPLPEIVFPAVDPADPEAVEPVAESTPAPVSELEPDIEPATEPAPLLEPEAIAPEPRPRLGRIMRERTQPALDREPNIPSLIPRPGIDDYQDAIPVPDRWRIVDTLGYQSSYFDPYNINPLKADRPFADDWFFNLGVISDTIYENREVLTPVGGSSTSRPGSNDVFGDHDQSAVNQNLLVELVWYKGNTVFKPPDYEFRLTTAFNYNYLQLDEVLGVNVDPLHGRHRHDRHIGIQAAFVDKHLRNVSDRYDFDSVRVGIQPFNADFRGFLFQDNQMGVRLFGTRENNIYQYNLALFQRIEKDTNSGLNDLGESLRDDYVAVANLYWQDLLVKGFISQFTLLHNRNEEAGQTLYDNNGFIVRPSSLGTEITRDYEVTYLGYSGDGHIGRVNLSTSLYYAFGKEHEGVFAREETDIDASFVAAELSMDFDWIRPRLSFLYASGDDDPYDNKSGGFDSVFENPQFAGSDTSYWIRQAVPLIGGGRVGLSSRNGLLNSLRSSKEQGQSNFTNPGITLAGVGVDLDILPELRISANWNSLHFQDTAVLEAARNQANIDKYIGEDISISATYRPLNSQNIVLRAAYAHLFPGQGFKDLFQDNSAGYFFLNMLLAY